MVVAIPLDFSQVFKACRLLASFTGVLCIAFFAGAGSKFPVSWSLGRDRTLCVCVCFYVKII